MNPLLKASLLALPALALGIQLVRPERSNPPVVQEPAWDSPATAALARRACYDCHSNATVYPWYSQVAPVSWLVAHHVEEGREHLNFSAIDGTEEADEMVEAIQEGWMPTWDYKLLHGEARLTAAEKDSLVAGLRRTFAEPAEPADSAVGPGEDREAREHEAGHHEEHEGHEEH